MGTASCRRCWIVPTVRFAYWPATLYGTIKRLIEEDMIVESDSRPAPDQDDARRRYYRLTPLGRRVLAAESERLEDLVRVIRAKRRLVTQEAES